jgi:hypothetical protein
LPSSETGAEPAAQEAQKPICHWCFKPIEGTPFVASCDIDLPLLYFHDRKEANDFNLAYFILFRDPDNFLRKDHEKRMKAYDAKILKELARSEKANARRKAAGAKAKAKNKTA